METKNILQDNLLFLNTIDYFLVFIYQINELFTKLITGIRIPVNSKKVTIVILFFNPRVFYG